MRWEGSVWRTAETSGCRVAFSEEMGAGVVIGPGVIGSGVAIIRKCADPSRNRRRLKDFNAAHSTDSTSRNLGQKNPESVTSSDVR